MTKSGLLALSVAVFLSFSAVWVAQSKASPGEKMKGRMEAQAGKEERPGEARREHAEIGTKEGRSTDGKQASAAAKPGRSEKMKERLEQLFIWRVSDKLQLTSQEEAKFSDEYHKLTEEKSRLTDRMETALDQIDKAKDDPVQSAKLLADYESAMKEYDGAQSKEMSTMGRLFGTKRMVQYVLLKREMRQKFKDFLVSSTNVKSPGAAPLKEPEVYQEK